LEIKKLREFFMVWHGNCLRRRQESGEEDKKSRRKEGKKKRKKAEKIVNCGGQFSCDR